MQLSSSHRYGGPGVCFFESVTKLIVCIDEQQAQYPHSDVTQRHVHCAGVFM